MRVPQVSDRIKEVPAQALRGVFAGIGQLLLITDKLRNKTPVGAGVPRARTPERTEPVADATVSERAAPRARAAEPAPAQPAPAQPAGAKPSSVKSAPAKPDTAKAAAAKPTRTEAPKPARTPRTRDFDKTGNVRLLDDAEASAAAAPGNRASTAPASAAPADVAAPVSPVPAVPAAGSGSEDSGPPLPNYDELSVASLRARLRNLDAAQVRQLAGYERAHAARADVIGMFERRIAKLEADA